jgi:TetR/AcrR family tetracycline transcriptional repressor
MALAFRPAPTARTRRRAAFLTRAEIVSAAARILERDGYDALNMRAVAAELGVQAAALYRHVESRGELDDLLFDRLMEDCAPEVGGTDWREDLAVIARAWRERLLARRDATRIALAQVSIGPNIAPLMDVAFAALRRAGLTETDVVAAYSSFVVFVHGFASEEARQRELAARPTDGVRIAPLPAAWGAAYPDLARYADALSAAPDFDARFAFGLQALIAGVEQRRGR